MEELEKNIYHHYLLFFVIFSKSFKEKFLIPTESCFLDRKKPNIAKLVDINFLADSMKIARLYPVRNFKDRWLFSANFIKMRLLGFFLHAEFLSALKTEAKPMVFEKYAKTRKKYLSSLLSIFCDFL